MGDHLRPQSSAEKRCNRTITPPLSGHDPRTWRNHDQRYSMKTWDESSGGPDRIQVYATLAEARAQFGENYGGFVFALSRAQVEALLNGQVVAFDINEREYAGFVVLREVAHE